LFHQGAPIAGSCILCRGRAKLFTQASGGRNVLLRFCRAGELLVIPVRDAHTVSAQAVGDAVVGMIPGDTFFNLLHLHPRLALEVIQQLSQELLRHRKRMVDLAAKTAGERLASLRLELMAEHGVEQSDGTVLIDLVLSPQDFADVIGCTRQTVSLELIWLREKGLLPYAHRRIIVLDPERMAQLVR
jgi:CRP-like cAMP-binding protein